MRMIPASPYQTNSTAEKKVFDKLRLVCQECQHDEYTCFHSMNLTRHAYKRFGEIDFLISCPEGLYVLEVKGGAVSCRNGVWQTKDRNGQVHKFRESPFRQAEAALHAQVSKLGDWRPNLIRQLVTGYGVVFPDCKLNCDGSEWERQIVYDLGAKKSFGEWLASLFGYWRKKIPQPEAMKAQPETLRDLRQFLRPEFEAIVPLYSLSREAHEQIAALTEDQMELVDAVSDNKRVLCSGGAGTGKTFLAVEFARRWTGEGQSVALVCRSPWLRNYLRSEYPIPGLTVSTLRGLKAEAARQGIEKYDALIVDEGQDLLHMDNLDVLSSLIRGGLCEGRWSFFHDVNNQSGFFGVHCELALKSLEGVASKFSLRRNCRNTKIILERVKIDTGADMGSRGGAGGGPEVRVATAPTIHDATALLVSEIKYVTDEGIAPEQVTILSPCDLVEPLVSGLPTNLLDRISVLDEHSMQNFPPQKISFSRIKDFKGLENEAVIVVGLPPPAGNSGSLPEHYVAMSRARTLLSMIYVQRQRAA